MDCKHLVVYIDGMAKPEAAAAMVPAQEAKVVPWSAELAGPSSSSVAEKEQEKKKQREKVVEEENEAADEETLLIIMAECRICQEEDSVNNLETPCACSGSLKYAHRKCVQHWCNEKGDITCEICRQLYQPGYTAPPRPESTETVIDIGGWHIAGTPLSLHDPRLLAIAEAERQLVDAEYDDYNVANASDASFCRAAALILMALLVMRHALGMTDNDDKEDTSTIFSLFLLRVIGFLLPCYIMVWAISILQRRRQRQEAAALAATQYALVVQSGQNRGLPFAIASAVPAFAPAPAITATPVTTPRQEHG